MPDNSKSPYISFLNSRARLTRYRDPKTANVGARDGAIGNSNPHKARMDLHPTGVSYIARTFIKSKTREDRLSQKTMNALTST